MAARISQHPAHAALKNFTLKLATVAMMASSLLALSGCLPKETALPASSVGTSSPVYGGFSGTATTQTISASKIKVTWGESTDASVVAYNIYDATFKFAPKLIRTVPAPANNVTLNSLPSGAYYNIRVRAADAKNKEDANMNDLPAITFGGAKPAVVQGSTSAYLPWEDASNGDQVNVYCKVGSASAETLMAQIHNTALTQTLLSGLTAGMQYSCRAAMMINGYVDNNTNYQTFTPLGTASQLVFSTQPVSSTAGVNFTPQPVVTIKDVNGNTVSAGPDASALITLSISSSSPSTGTVRGSFAVAAVAGVATFSGINIQESGLKILSATKGDTSGLPFGSAALSSDSDAFTITPDVVSVANSAMTISPAGPLVANGTSPYTVSMTLKDQYGNPVAGVTPRFASSNTADILTQPTGVTDASGTVTAQVSTLSVGGIMNNGVRTLSISSPAGLGAVSKTAVFTPGPATKLVFTSQPQQSPAGPGGMTADVIVQVQDSNDNLVAAGDAPAMTTVEVALSSAPGGGVLLGTTSVVAVNGIATFSGLGIDRSGINYKMKALAPYFPTLTQGNSSLFTITAASPTKLGITSANSTLTSALLSSTGSNVCGTYTIALLDGGGNPSKGSATISLSSLKSGGAPGNVVFYNGCTSSAAVITTLNINNQTSGTVYARDPAAETVDLNVSAVGLTTATYNLKVNPSQFVLAGGPVSALSGGCTPAFTLNTQGANGSAGVVPVDTAFSFTFLNSGSATSAVAYKDAACTQSIGTSPASVTMTTGNSAASVYLKDTVAEGPVVVTFASQNSMTSATSSPTNQNATFLASQISLVAPVTPVVAGGTCVGPFQVKVKDAAGTVVTSATNVLNIDGQTSNTKWYASSACSTPVTTVTLTAGAANLWLADSTVETLNVSISDPTAAPLKMTTSSVTSIKVSPYKLAWTTPSTSTSATKTGPTADASVDNNVCLAMTLASQYSNGTNVAPLSAVTVGLNGAGSFNGTTPTGASFYSDSICSTRITTTTLSGSATTTVYFMGRSPAAFSLTASDAASVIATSAAITHTVSGEKAWIGSRVGGPSVNDINFTWGTGQGVGVGRTDGPQSMGSIHFDASKRYLFVADFLGHRVFKYDYTNGKYLGWIGGFYNNGGNANAAAIGGGALGCLSITNDRQQTPGWCYGGTARATQPQTYGNFYTPISMTDDGYNLYVANFDGDSITMYNMATGEFEGWLGVVYSSATPSTPTGSVTTIQPGTAASAGSPNGAQLANNCASLSTTGVPSNAFCIGGDNANGYSNRGDGSVYQPRGVLWANNRLYVSQNGQISMFEATPGASTMGNFLGWVGWIQTGYVPTSCVLGTPAANTQTPGWCVGGRSQNKVPVQAGGLYTPGGMYADVANDYLYITDYGTASSNSRILRYKLSTGEWVAGTGAAAGLRLATGLVNPSAITSDGTNLFVADWSRLLQTDLAATSQLGWVGKIYTSPSAPAACNGLATPANTPGWCSNGTSMSGLDENSFNTLSALEYDGAGKLITGQRYYPVLKKFISSTGVYVNQMVLPSTSPTYWTTTTEYATNQGYDDKSMNQPLGMAVDKVNNIMYVVERGNARVKKISTITGEVLGWIGATTSLPTGGDAACTASGVSTMQASPGWCKGSLPNPNYLWSLNGSINQQVNLLSQQAPGAMYSPAAITYDGTYLFVTDITWHRIHRFEASTGLYRGWIGFVNTSPISGDSTCSTTTDAFTPGWCYGGTSKSSNLDGGMNYPTGIWNSGGFLYVYDNVNARLNKYNASSGAFVGWVGRMGTNTASCTTDVRSSTTYTKGWCKGSGGANSSLATRAGYNGDPGGGIASYTNGNTQFEMIDGDSTYFYTSNAWNNRIDRWWLNTGTGHVSGEWAGAVNVKYTIPLPAVSTWTTTMGAWGDIYWNNPTYIFPTGVHIDAARDRLYYMSNKNAVVMRKLSDGSFLGWQGGILSGSPPSSCAPSGNLSGTVTPGWCVGGSVVGGYKIGQFSWNASAVTGDDNFVYISDDNTHRVTRIPK